MSAGRWGGLNRPTVTSVLADLLGGCAAGLTSARQLRPEDGCQDRYHLVDVLRHVVELHVAGALHDIELLVFAGGSLQKIIAHPFAPRAVARKHQEGLGRKCHSLGEGVIRNDLREAARRCPARGGRRLRSRGVVVVPGFVEIRALLDVMHDRCSPRRPSARLNWQRPSRPCIATCPTPTPC